MKTLKNMISKKKEPKSPRKQDSKIQKGGSKIRSAEAPMEPNIPEVDEEGEVAHREEMPIRAVYTFGKKIGV